MCPKRGREAIMPPDQEGEFKSPHRKQAQAPTVNTFSSGGKVKAVSAPAAADQLTNEQAMKDEAKAEGASYVGGASIPSDYPESVKPLLRKHAADQGEGVAESNTCAHCGEFADGHYLDRCVLNLVSKLDAAIARAERAERQEKVEAEAHRSWKEATPTERIDRFKRQRDAAIARTEALMRVIEYAEGQLRPGVAVEATPRENVMRAFGALTAAVESREDA